MASRICLICNSNGHLARNCEKPVPIDFSAVHGRELRISPTNDIDKQHVERILRQGVRALEEKGGNSGLRSRCHKIIVVYVPKFPLQSIAQAAHRSDIHSTTLNRGTGEKAKDFPHLTIIALVGKNNVRAPCHIYMEQTESPRHFIAATAWGNTSENRTLVEEEYRKIGVTMLEDHTFCFGVKAAELITIWW